MRLTRPPSANVVFSIMQGTGSRVIASPDHGFVCAVEDQQITVSTMPALELLAQIGTVAGSQVAIAGRFVVVLASSGQLYVIDPATSTGPQKVAEITIDGDCSIIAWSGDHVLISRGNGALVVAIGSNGQPTLAALPTRSLFGASGPGARDHFIVAKPGELEEWSAISRSPLRRFRLAQPAVARHVGACARHVWFVAEQSLVAIPTATPARSVRVELPEPAVRIICDDSGTLAMIGATTGGLWSLRLADRTVTLLDAGPIDDVDLGHAGGFVGTRGKTLVIYDSPYPPTVRLVVVPRHQPQRAPSPIQPGEPASIHQRLSAWKDRTRDRSLVRAAPSSSDVPEPSTAIATTTPSAIAVPTRTWRDSVVELAECARARRTFVDHDAAASLIDRVADRFELDDLERAALRLLYGARLCARDVAPAELASVIGWDEALGRGRLVRLGAFTWRRDRVQLEPEVVAVLDERPAYYGITLGGPGDVGDRICVVVPSELDPATVGAWAAPELGALFVPNARGLRSPGRFVAEARARGVAPLIPWCDPAWPRELPASPAVVMVNAMETKLEFPIGLVWPAVDAA